jgi:hypothetical protein
MTRAKICLAIALIGHATVSPAARIGIACVGTSFAEHNLTGAVRQSAVPMPKQIYVIDEERKTVERALMPRQEFETVCSSKKGPPFVSISPGLVLVSAAPDFSVNGTECSLELDRQTGKAVYVLKMNFEGGHYDQLRWEMTCEKSSIPVFHPEKNKF